MKAILLLICAALAGQWGVLLALGLGDGQRPWLIVFSVVGLFADFVTFVLITWWDG